MADLLAARTSNPDPVEADAPTGPRADRSPPALSDLWFDAAVAVVVTLTQVVAIAVVGSDDGESVPIVAYLVMALSGLPLVLRRRHPVLVGAVVGLATAAYGMADWPDPPLYLGGLIALYTVASLARRDAAITIGAGTAGIVVLLWLFDPAPNDLNDLLTPILAASTAWWAGLAAGAQRRTIALLSERSERIEQERRDDAERIVAQERLRIARELHDITAHHVSVMAVQAEAGAATPADATKALRNISASARLALADLRRMLSVLRSSTGPDLRQPQPGLDDLDELIGHVRAGGLNVDLHRGGPPVAEDGLELTAYRIIQEALTNVVRHSGARRVEVRVDASTEGISIEVADDGHGTMGALVEGHGLRGMRERVALYGGELQVGPRPPYGFSVRARLKR